jgi:molecular chaperone Hsp33
VHAVSQPETNGGDLLLPFLLGPGLVRGRVVRLGPALDRILGGHGYPALVAERLAETVTLAAGLAGALKYEGVFTLQIQGKGAISLLVVDVTSDGDLRAYARFDAERLAQAAGGEPVAGCFGEGFLAFTVDQGPGTDRYQGIVALEGATLADCARAYFRQSEQLDTEIALAVRHPGNGRGWLAGAAIIQRMPLGPGSPILTTEEADEAWGRAVALLRSLRADELLDDRLAAHRLLDRLYHADRLRASAPRALRAGCRCSEERVRSTLAAFPPAELAEITGADGNVVVTCEFCRTDYLISATVLEHLHAPATHTP